MLGYCAEALAELCCIPGSGGRSSTPWACTGTCKLFCLGDGGKLARIDDVGMSGVNLTSPTTTQHADVTKFQKYTRAKC